MIRFATQNDINGIIALWSEAFGDSEEDIRFFLDNRFIPENTLLYENNGKIVSMLFLLDGNMIINGSEYPSYYLYAACTAKDCRGRGLMASLLGSAKSVASNREKYFICLMPGEKSLFEFYERFGYKTVFSRKILNVKSSDLSDLKPLSDNYRFNNYFEKRKNAFWEFNRFEWDEFAIDFACKSHLLYGGKVENNCKGYALYSVNENDLLVKEFAFSEKNLAFELKKLFDSYCIETAEIHLPCEYKTEIGSYKITASAMAVSVRPEYEILLSDVNNAYLGLTLD